MYILVIPDQGCKKEKNSRKYFLNSNNEEKMWEGYSAWVFPWASTL